MKKPAISLCSAMLLVAVLAGWAKPTRADVAYTEVLRVPESQHGPFGSVRSHVLVSESAIRRETLPRMSSRPRVHASIIPNLEGLIPAIEILRTDRDSAWRISPSGQFRSGRLRQVLLGSEPAAEPSELQALANLKSESDRAVLRRTGFKRKINGFVCVHLFATVTSQVRDSRTGEKGTLVLMSDLWVAEDAPGTREIRGFLRSLGERFGLDEYFCADAALLAEVMPEQSRKIAEMVSQVDGLPVSNTFTAKLRRISKNGEGPTETLYSLTADLLGIRPVRPEPRRFEPPAAVSNTR